MQLTQSGNRRLVSIKVEMQLMTTVVREITVRDLTNAEF